MSDSIRFTAEVSDQYSNALTGAAVSWSTSDAAVAMVNASGVATAASAGTAAITATSGNASGSAAVTVVQEVSAVIVTPAEAALAPGDTVTLTARAEDANGSPIEDALFAWSSSNTAVGTVDTTGLVHAIGDGSAAITATSGMSSGHARITVVEDSQRMALEAFYRSTGGEEWINQGNWLTDAPLGQWYGVTAREGRVVSLLLMANNLNGPIPPQIEHLTSLRTVRLGDNLLSGEIPPELGNLSSLHSLNLSVNALSGPIPPELGRLDRLGFLHLSINNLSGRDTHGTRRSHQSASPQPPLQRPGGRASHGTGQSRGGLVHGPQRQPLAGYDSAELSTAGPATLRVHRPGPEPHSLPARHSRLRRVGHPGQCVAAKLL
ncbi:Ig-like domain-containing protein [Candidatus Palauibacter sp.]|uniref:Ig-like domain-containing protein n=1 Tax=Candidatus Palauibacter sp. TaxID=3101350 RepID=UPI003B02408E